MKIEANCRTTGIGSVPCKDATAACDLVLRYFDIPYWPQLPKRDPREGMPQFFRGYPGLVIEDNRVRIDRAKFESQLEGFYLRIIGFETGGMIEGFAIGERHALGFYKFLELKERMKGTTAIKGQIIGPVSFGLNVMSSNGRPMIYDDDMRDALIRNLALKARYQEEMLRTISPNTMIFVDEASLGLIYSPHVGYDEVRARQDLETILGAIKGVKGVHCCADTNWPFLLDLVDVLSFDAYNYSDRFVLHRGAIKSFIDRGGIIAWGIVPTSENIFHEDAITLMKRLESNFQCLAASGIEYQRLLNQCLITPACGLGTKSHRITIRAFDLTREISARLRQKHAL